MMNLRKRNTDPGKSAQAKKCKKAFNVDNSNDSDDHDEDEDDHDEDDDDDEDEDDEDDDEEQEQKNDVNTPIKGADKSEKPQTSKAKTPKNEIQEKGSSAEVSEILEETAQRREMDLRTLFVGNLPANTTPNELKALSSDITEVIPRAKSHCFIRFASEEKADVNYKALQGKELKSHLLNVDYIGEKRKNFQKEETKEKISLETLYVGNLPMDVTSDELKALTADIEVVCLPKKFQNPLNPYAFITFASKEEAYANYKALQGKKLRGRVLKIQFARENILKKAQRKIKEVSEILEETAQRRERNLRTLFVGNLPANTTPNELKALSSDITDVIPGAKSNFFQGYCCIIFASEKKADANYKALQGKELKGHLLVVDYMGEKCKNIQEKETKGKNKKKFQQENDLPKKGKFTKKRIVKLKG
ncbi:multiple RNA-binding domain-containing protein 1 [Trichonephila inaurata madagascariensis]|uniref:Multiple RNA-binding domain-containing protein 1 n=1 Tax=Trichonephila inaurata madagascariensis TaxID=2747483 RepID=A0A8X7CDZ3_9ARAC|nr:multiple RNA-binding domain-containing protein 1 [Trichonephila inaurata madagascariensis]